MGKGRHKASKKVARKPATNATTELQRLSRMGRTNIPFPIPGASYYENHVAPSRRLTQAALPGESGGPFYYNPLISLHDSVEATLRRKLADEEERSNP